MDEPLQVEQGRYRVLADGQGSWWLYRATGTCQTCQGCGCGEQAEPVEVPDLSMGMVAVMSWMARNGNKGVMASLGGMLNGSAAGRGNGDGEAAAKVRRRPGRRRDSNGAVGHADQEADRGGDADRAAAASGSEGGGQQ